jgi:alpha-galactosidase
MGDALKKTGRPIVFAICEWGQRKPWQWARAAGGHLWRTTWDSRDAWKSNDSNLTGIMEIFDQQEGLENYAGPGGWNDPDLLMVGLYGKGKSSSVNGRFKGCSTTEYRTHFALWAMLAAPLIVNLDLRKLDKETAEILLNREIISINQDALGKQGYTIIKTNEFQLLRKDLSGGDVAVCVFNRSDKPLEISLNIQKDLDIWFPFKMLEIYGKKEISKVNKIQISLPVHDCRVYRFTRNK